MSTNPIPKYTVLERELEFTNYTVPLGMARFQFPRRCMEPENLLIFNKKMFLGAGMSMEHLHQRTEYIPRSAVSPGRSPNSHVNLAIWTRTSVEIHLIPVTSPCLLLEGVLAKKPNVSRSGGC